MPARSASQAANGLGAQIGTMQSSLEEVATDLKNLMSNAGSAGLSQAGDQLKEIQSTLKSMTDTLSGKAANTAQQGYERIGEELRALRARADEIGGDIRDRAEQATDDVRDTIQDRPWTSVAAAFAAGYILALLLRR